MRRTLDPSRPLFDAIIIGSGFGGSFAAHALVEAGWQVLLIERGPWVPRGPEASRVENFVLLSPYYSLAAGYRARNQSRRVKPVGALFCVGGASVFYGGVSLRFRPSDFEPVPDLVGDSGAEWPFGYGELEPYYREAEELLGVGLPNGRDPATPWSGDATPSGGIVPSRLADRLAGAARSLGLAPVRLPLAINFQPGDGVPGGGQGTCVRCGRCDGWPCPVFAKNDMATRMLQPLLSRGLTLLPDTAAVRLIARNGRIEGVECQESGSGQRSRFEAREVLVAGGALATPQLLLASGLAELNPGGHTVGRYLTRHANAIVFGRLREAFAVDGLGKDLAVLDYYDGDAAGRNGWQGPLGSLQSMPMPSEGVIATQVPPPLPWLAGKFLRRSAGLLAIAHEQPRERNGIVLDRSRADPAGLPGILIEHRYSPRDRARRDALCRRALAILRRAGGWFFYQHEIRTFSHAMGTVRMGRDPRTSALDGECRFRGIENLRIVDASVFPTSGGVNPSLTIAATALRAARRLAGVARSRAA